MKRMKMYGMLKNILIWIGAALIAYSTTVLIYRLILRPDVQEEKSVPSEPSKPDFKILFLNSYSPVHSSYGRQETGLKAGLYPNDISYKSREPRVSCLNPGKTSRDLLQHVSRPDSPTMAREQ